MIVNVLEPAHGVLLDPACGSGGMFVQTGDFVNHAGTVSYTHLDVYKRQDQNDGHEIAFFKS